MITKPKVSASGTYVLDPEDVEELDQLSITSVVTALVEAVPEDQPRPHASTEPKVATKGGFNSG